jgi:hypothetical protein
VIEQLRTIDRHTRRCIYIWGGITAVLVILALSVYFAGGTWRSYLAMKFAEELSWNPSVRMQIEQMRQQGVPEQQVNQQLLRAGDQQAAGMVAVMKTAALWSAVVAVLVLALLWALLVARGAKPHERRLAVYGIVALAAIQLMYVAARYVYVEDTSRTLDLPDAIAALQAATPPFRVAVLDQRDPLYNLWITSLFNLHGIECINVPADSRPAADRKLFFYSSEFSPARRWQYANVRYLLGRRDTLDTALRSLGIRNQCVSFFEFDADGARHAVYEFTNTLPRVFAVGSWQSVTNGSDALAAMNAAATDPARIAVVTGTNLDALTQPGFNADVTIDSYRPERIAVTAALPTTGLVVMATEPGDGWHASVDGEHVPLVRCNILHQGVIVPPGTHSVTFAYSKRHWVTRVNNWSYLALPVLLVGTCGLLAVRRRGAGKSYGAAH